MVPGQSSEVPCHAFLWVPACHLLTAGHGTAEALSIHILPNSVSGFSPTLTSSTRTNVMFLFCMRMYIWVGKKLTGDLKPCSPLRLQETQLETYRKHTVHLYKTSELTFCLLEFLKCIDKLKIRFLNIFSLVFSTKLQSSIFIIPLYYLVMFMYQCQPVTRNKTKIGSLEKTVN